MPVHRVLVTEVEKKTAEIEQSEHIVSVVESGDQSVLIFTEPSNRKAPGSKETR
jgi:hypothetical protein